MTATIATAPAVMPLPLLTWAPFALLALAVVALWASRAAAWAILAGAIALGYASGVLSGPALLWLAVFALACWAYTHMSARELSPSVLLVKLGSLAGILILGLALGLHRLPGFHNVRALAGVVLSPRSAPYDLWLNFDKTAAGLVVLAVCYRRLIRKRGELAQALKLSAVPALLTVIVLLGLSAALGYVAWAPKWSGTFWLWASVNLLFTCMSEEAFFRGFIQTEVRRSTADIPGGAAVAVISSALLFGLAHFAGGWTYVALASVAGLGYAIVYERSGRIEMSMLTHFSLNALHFVLFTYPYLSTRGSSSG